MNLPCSPCQPRAWRQSVQQTGQVAIKLRRQICLFFSLGKTATCSLPFESWCQTFSAYLEALYIVVRQKYHIENTLHLILCIFSCTDLEEILKIGFLASQRLAFLSCFLYYLWLCLWTILLAFLVCLVGLSFEELCKPSLLSHEVRKLTPWQVVSEQQLKHDIEVTT